MNNKIIPYGKQEITKSDIDCVIDVLNSDFLTQGPTIKEFEEKFASYVGSKYAVAVANGTAALHLCTLALNIKKGDRVIMTPITFVASANCVRYCDGEVIFCDIDPNTYLMDLNKAEEMLAQYPKGHFKGFVSVDFSGRAVDLERLKELAEIYGMWIIEDACHAPGGYFVDSKGVNQKCGNGSFADLSIFSFHPVKHIATGEGGMITTNNENLYRIILEYRTHGITRNTEKFTNDIDFACGVEGQDSYPGWYMEMQNLGFNYRLTDFQAALGLSQLQRSVDGLQRRKQIAAKYFSAFNGEKFIKGQSGIIEGNAYHLYIIQVENRLELYNYLKMYNIFAQVHYIPCHLMPYYRELGWKEHDMPKAEEYYRTCLSIPIYPSLLDEEVEFVISKIKEFYG
jgi:UDP-4-amino-4,6-dideoxy-N-acetyl-beta-L-altrosamine transaminase